MNLYDKLYYSIYVLLRSFGNYGISGRSRLLFSLLIVFNIITILILISNENILNFMASFWGIIILSLPIMIFNDIYLTKRNTLEYFSKINNDSRKKYKLIGSIYALISIVCLYIVI